MADKRHHLPAIKLYNNIQELDDSCSAEMAYLKALLENKTAHYVENITAEFNLLQVDNIFFPILISSENYRDSYVCSPYGNYVSLALESASQFKNKWLRKISEYTFKSLGTLIKRGKINHAIYINHSFFSTDLHDDDLPKSVIDNIIIFLKKQFPKHAVIFRSINLQTCGNLRKQLKSCGFKFIASRQIYLTYPQKKELFQTRIIKSDIKLWNEKKYDLIEEKDFTDEDEPRLLELYWMLAIDHHSKHNPQLKQSFIKLLRQNPNFTFKALKKEGKIEGVVGYHMKDGILLCSFLGYDKHHENKRQIYRLLSTMLLLEASQHAKIFHQSAGASFYKSIRRAKGYMEYQAIYTKHLPLKQKFAWHFLKSVINTFAVPFMKKY